MFNSRHPLNYANSLWGRTVRRPFRHPGFASPFYLRFALALWAIVCVCPAAEGSAVESREKSSQSRLVELSLEKLMNVELSMVGQNLFDNHHPEFTAELTGVQPAQVRRGVYGKVACHF